MTKKVPQVKIVFFGTSEFAVPVLKKLHETGYEIVAVITQPDKPAGRKQNLLPSPVKIDAQKRGLKILQPPRLSSLPVSQAGPASGEELKQGDLFVVASYGNIIPAPILELPKYGALNIHPSLLPKYRGPSPIQAAILNGDKETGVTIIKLDEKMDHGPILASRKLKVKSEKFKELHDTLAEMGTELLIKILPEYIAGKTKLVPQDHSKATFTKIITKNNARIDWSKSAEEIDRQVRAYSDWPVAWTTLDGKRLKIFEAHPLPFPPHQGEAIPTPFLPLEGESRVGVIIIMGGKILVTTGSGHLEILSLQLAGGKRMPAKDFLNGYHDLSGVILK